MVVASGLTRVFVLWCFRMVNVESMLNIPGLMHLLLGICWSMPLRMSKCDQFYGLFNSKFTFFLKEVVSSTYIAYKQSHILSLVHDQQWGSTVRYVWFFELLLIHKTSTQVLSWWWMIWVVGEGEAGTKDGMFCFVDFSTVVFDFTSKIIYLSSWEIFYRCEYWCFDFCPIL